MSRHAAPPPVKRRRTKRRGSGRFLTLGVLVIVLAFAALGVYLVNTGGVAAPAASTEPAPEVAQTYFGTVAGVWTPSSVAVTVDGREMTVRVLGLYAPQGAQCGALEALSYAKKTLDGQRVTVVPDPTLRAQREPDGRLRGYLVLPDQLSYTDDAIRKGWARPDPTLRTWYQPVFEREDRDAAQAAAGLWRTGACWGPDQ